MKVLVMDLDNTICKKITTYEQAVPNLDVIKKLKEYKKMGFQIVINTSRNMHSFDKNVGKINAKTLPIIHEWLLKNDVPFDEIHVGKPWCGNEGFYVDDKAIRPNEFEKLTYEEIKKLLD